MPQFENQAAMLETAATMFTGFALNAAGAIVTLILGFIVAGIARSWTRKALGRMRYSDETLTEFLANLVRYGVLIIFGVAVLGQFGVETASILAALGAAGLAIGLALQGTLQNIAAGIMLLVLRPLRVGEYVDAGGIDGTVEEIGLFATRMKTLDGLFRMVPNSQLWNVPVTNYSRHDTRRNDLVMGIGYNDDIKAAKERLSALADSDNRVLADPQPALFVSDLGDNSVSVTMRYWTQSADWFATANDLRLAAKQQFDEAGISIPYPQRDIHIISQGETVN